MTLSSEQVEGLDTALNESTLLGVEFDPTDRLAGVTVDVLALPAEGEPRDDNRVLLVLEGVERIAVSLRHGFSSDRDAFVERFEVDELYASVARVAGNAMYGWRFVDVPDESFRAWSDRLSLDWRSGESGGSSHSLELFQESLEDGQERHLDLRIWFDTLHVARPDGAEVPLDDFIAEGRRWWEAFHADDPRTAGRGLVRLREGIGGGALRALLGVSSWLVSRRGRRRS